MNSIAANQGVSSWSPNYRRFELPWSTIEEEAKRFKKSLTWVMVTLLVLSVVIPFLPVSEV